MNRIDKRTGDPFPSVQRQDYLDQTKQLTADSPSLRKVRQELANAQLAAEVYSGNDWRLELDPRTLRQYGVFVDSHVLYGEFDADEIDDSVERPLEWFRRVGELTKESLHGSGELWQVINAIFDKAIVQADAELGFEAS